MANSLLLCLSFCVSLVIFYASLAEGNFLKTMDFSWGSQHISGFLGAGEDATLVLDQISGSGIQSKKSFIFGSIEMLIKLAPGHSAGTVTAYYLSSTGKKHDEIDFEFLGNVSGQPYAIHTNIFTQGGGGREQQFNPWFDPTADYHNYTIRWNPSHVVWYVDSIPIRVYRNYESEGIPYPSRQAMAVYSSIWNGDSWATRCGDVKIDWTKAPFVARLRRFRARTCEFEGSESVSRCTAAASGYWWSSPGCSQLSNAEQDQMKAVRKNYMVYDYCRDIKRYKGLLPGECFKEQY